MNNKDIVLHKIPRLEKERGIYTFLLITITTFITHFYFSRLKKTNLVTGPILHLKLPHKFVCVWFIAKTEKQREHTEQTKNIRPVVERVSPNPTNHTNMSYTFLATDVEPISQQHTEPTEDIRIHLLAESEVQELLESGEIVQALHAAPLWKYFAQKR